MLHLVFTLFEVTLSIAFERLLFFNLLLPLKEILVEITEHVSLLVLLHLLHFWPNILDRFFKFLFQFVNTKLLLELFSSRNRLLFLLSIIAIRIVHLPHLKLLLQLSYLDSIILLSHVVSPLPVHDVLLDLLVFIIHFFQLVVNVTVPLVPLVWVYVAVGVLDVLASDLVREELLFAHVFAERDGSFSAIGADFSLYFVLFEICGTARSIHLCFSHSRRLLILLQKFFSFSLKLVHSFLSEILARWRTFLAKFILHLPSSDTKTGSHLACYIGSCSLFDTH